MTTRKKAMPYHLIWALADADKELDSALKAVRLQRQALAKRNLEQANLHNSEITDCIYAIREKLQEIEKPQGRGFEREPG